MEVGESQNVDLEARSLGFVNNNQFSENQANPDTSKFPGSISVEEEIDISFRIDTHELLPELNESTEPERTQRHERYNLRKSLAWDSAFFTSSGVLDPEELSSMITVADKCEKHLLPGIEEDVTGSTESISNLESDNLTLEKLEDDLFLDIRASIQRSSEKKSNLTNTNSERGAMEVDNAAISSLKRESHSSKNKIQLNPKPVLKKTSGLQTVRMSKCEPKQNIGKTGTGKAKHISGHSQPVAKIGESNSSLSKPPKAISRLIPTSTATPKRDLMGASRLKSDPGSSKLVSISNKGPQPSKISVAKVARRELGKPAVPSASLLGSSNTSRVQSTRSSTSSNDSGGISSETTAKSPLMTTRRNPVKSSHVGTASSGFLPKTPSRAALKNKPPSSTLSSYLMSTKISSSVSPASSISEWSSVSSSCSMVNQRSITSSCRSIDDDIILLDAKNHSTDRTRNENKSQGIASPRIDSNKSTTQTGTVQSFTKPSGLRMPSPKMGFFDGVKLLPRTPNGHLKSQSGLHIVYPKSGAANSSPTRNSNIKLMSSKVSTGRTVTALAYIKPDSPRAPPPAFEEKLQTPGKEFSVSTDVKDSCGLSLELKSKKCEESFEKTQKVHVRDGIKQVVLEGEHAIINANLDNSNDETEMNMHKIMDTEVIKINPIEVNSVSHTKYGGGRGTDDLLCNQNYVKNGLNPICETDDKENGRIQDQGEGLVHNREINPKASVPKDEPSYISDLASASVPTTATESAAHRSPLVLKNFYCGKECLDISQDSATLIAAKIALASPSSKNKEN